MLYERWILIEGFGFVLQFRIPVGGLDILSFREAFRQVEGIFGLGIGEVGPIEMCFVFPALYEGSLGKVSVPVVVPVTQGVREAGFLKGRFLKGTVAKSTMIKGRVRKVCPFGVGMIEGTIREGTPGKVLSGEIGRTEGTTGELLAFRFFRGFEVGLVLEGIQFVVHALSFLSWVIHWNRESWQR